MHGKVGTQKNKSRHLPNRKAYVTKDRALLKVDVSQQKEREEQVRCKAMYHENFLAKQRRSFHRAMLSNCARLPIRRVLQSLLFDFR